LVAALALIFGPPVRAEGVANEAGAQNAQVWTARHMIGTKPSSVQ
jgi:hypothetical protein